MKMRDRLVIAMSNKKISVFNSYKPLKSLRDGDRCESVSLANTDRPDHGPPLNGS